MKIIASIAAMLLGSLISTSEVILGSIVDSDNNESIPFASIKVEFSDTTMHLIANEMGQFNFTARSFPLNLVFRSVGMKTKTMTLSEIPQKQLLIALEHDTTALDEVTVTATKKLTQLIDGGLVYNMSNNERAQSENSLQALAYIPLLNINFDGEITIQGSSNYSLYLNDKPYDMAQASPKAFLESLPASTIKEVEIITAPTEKFGSVTGQYIINIILKGKLIDGYNINIAGGGSSQPRANGAVLSMIKKHNVDFSLNYDYNLNGQRNQPTEIDYEYINDIGKVIEQSKSVGNGNGDWQSHTMRAMFNWQIDSLNSIYADFHGRINTTDTTGDWLSINSKEEVTQYDNKNHYTEGSIESNIMYRNYFNDDKTMEQFMLGYHFTFNPDKRHYTQRYYIDDVKSMTIDQQTDGGMLENSLRLSYLLRFSKQHFLRVSLNDILRHGDTDSYINLNHNNSMSYWNNIAGLSLKYSGRFNNVDTQIKLGLDHDYWSMELTGSQSEDFNRDNIYVTPAIMAFWRINTKHMTIFNYTTSINRPTVSMLNPFRSTIDEFSYRSGNPNLSATYINDVAFTWYFIPTQNLTLLTTADYTYNSDLILQYEQLNNDGKIETTYGNIGNSHQAQIITNINYTPTKWVSLQLDGNIGFRRLLSSQLCLKQNNWFYNITPRVNFFLPSNFRIGAQWGLYKSTPNPRSTKNETMMYSFYVSKSFFKGKLNLSLQANSPFSKYHTSISTTNLPNLYTHQTNKITARSFGFNLSYTFGSGQKIELHRDNTLKSEDQSTGVR